MTEVIQGGKIPLESHLVVDNVYIELKDIHVEEYRLFIDGIAFISGVNVGDYSDIDYRLIFKSKDHEHTLSLAKGNKPEITEKFSTSKDVSYDKCWFTTFIYNYTLIFRGDRLPCRFLADAHCILLRSSGTELAYEYNNILCIWCYVYIIGPLTSPQQNSKDCQYSAT